MHCPKAATAIDGLEVYPVHVAAQQGDDETLRILLDVGADPEVTCQGRTAADFAQEVNVNGSHVHVLNLLQKAIQVTEVAV